MKINKISIHSSGGFTLIETMLVLVIALAATTVTFVTGRRAYETSKVQDAQQLASQVSDVVSARFSTFPNLTGVQNSMRELMPSISTATATGVILASPWGPAQVVPRTVFAVNDTWALSFTEVPSNGCVALLTRVSEQFRSVEVNGVAVVSPPGEAINPQTAMVMCDNANNTVAFVSSPLLTRAQIRSPGVGSVSVALSDWSNPNMASPESVAIMPLTTNSTTTLLKTTDAGTVYAGTWQDPFFGTLAPPPTTAPSYSPPPDTAWPCECGGA